MDKATFVPARRSCESTTQFESSTGRQLAPVASLAGATCSPALRQVFWALLVVHSHPIRDRDHTGWGAWMAGH